MTIVNKVPNCQHLSKSVWQAPRIYTCVVCSSNSGQFACIYTTSCIIIIAKVHVSYAMIHVAHFIHRSTAQDENRLNLVREWWGVECLYSCIKGRTDHVSSWDLFTGGGGRGRRERERERERERGYE